MKYFKITAIAILVILVIMQFFRIDKTNPETSPENDFLTSVNAPQEIHNMIKTSCYDCHSNETVYPWYSNFAPVSWMLKSHINEARDNINFSEWSDFTNKSKIGIYEDCIDMIDDHDMPLASYKLMHKEARLSDNQRNELITWFKKLEESTPITDSIQ